MSPTDVRSDPFARYRSPLETRYASAAMQSIWSERNRIGTWRRVWIALAETQHELGLPVTREQVEELKATVDNIDFDAAARYESELRHDVMAHIHAWRDIAPGAGPIIHLGATSQFVNCNAEAIMLRSALDAIAGKIASLIDALGDFAVKHRDVPTLGFTHYQPAQPTTVGRRAAQWAYDLSLTLEDIEQRIASLRLRGAKGTTGTQASFLSLFDGDHEKVTRLDEMITAKLGWPADARLVISGQTYPRLIDGQILSALATVAAVVHKFATDLRLLANRKEVEEPFAKKQIGSSAMAYKRNPMRSERACGMCRFVMTLAPAGVQTASVQWFERTLDDSSIRRLVLPEAFLALDGALDVMHNVAHGMVIYPATIARNLLAELPFMATENLMMAAVRGGADRQEAHEVIRQHSVEAGNAVKRDGAENDLLSRLAAEPMFQGIDVEAALDPRDYIGRAPEQVDEVIRAVIEPIRSRYGRGATAHELSI